MKLWKVVVVADLALALGIGFGWVWWGPDGSRQGSELALGRSTSPAGATRWSGRGVVRGILADAQVLVLTHEELPGFMPAMTMGFRVASAAVYAGVQIGDEIRFTVDGTPPAVAITAIEKLQ